MSLLISKLVSKLLLPPTSLILLFMLGIIMLKRHYVWGRRIIGFALFAFFILSLPVTAMKLMSWIETYPALSRQTIENTDAKAIIILGGGRHYDAAEYEGDTVSESSLERLRYGVRLHRQTHLPILVSGGAVFEDRVSEGELMQRALQEDFLVSPGWIETTGRNTAENAMYSYAMLEKENIKEILLVTHAWHMPRAVKIFQRQGFHVTAAPMSFAGVDSSSLRVLSFIPSAESLLKSYKVLHELIGRLWYAIRY